MATLALVMATELDAVNTMLRYINEQPVASIGETISEAVLAQAQLHEMNRLVQSTGLECNTILNKEFTADFTGIITIPADVISIDASDLSLNVALRDNQLYDLDNDTNTWTSGKKIKCDFVRFLGFEELPEYVRRYITLLATVEFVLTELGETAVYDRLVRRGGPLQSAKLEFMRNERKNKNNNILSGNLSVNQAVNRRYNPRNF